MTAKLSKQDKFEESITEAKAKTRPLGGQGHKILSAEDFSRLFPAISPTFAKLIYSYTSDSIGHHEPDDRFSR